MNLYILDVNNQLTERNKNRNTKIISQFCYKIIPLTQYNSIMYLDCNLKLITKTDHVIESRFIHVPPFEYDTDCNNFYGITL